MEAPTRWGTRAASVYDEAYAKRYRAHDESREAGDSVARLGEWLGGVCGRFPGRIDALDLGCGTGRYFHSLRRVRRLVGIDVSRPMLEQARNPAGVVAPEPPAITLVEGDFLKHEFGSGEFDLVYSIGVLAEHSPFDDAVASRVNRWLAHGGRFAFTTVDPSSFSVPRTLKRRAGEQLLPFLRGTPRRALRARLMGNGLYADQERVSEVLDSSGFAIESMELFKSDVHLHVLTVARRQDQEAGAQRRPRG